MVERSSRVNIAQLVGSQSGEVLVPTYDWLSFFAASFRKLSGIKKYHQFTFTNNYPGQVLLKEYSDSTNITHYELLKSDIPFTSGDLPPTITPQGLSDKRQWYLYEKIRPFCSERTNDLVCPLPTVPRARYTPTPQSSPYTSPLQSPSNSPPRKQRKCGNCGENGHNRRSCQAQHN